MNSLFDKVTGRHVIIMCTNLAIICSVNIGDDIGVHVAVSIGVGAGVSVSIDIGVVIVIGVGVGVSDQRFTVRKLASESWRQKIGDN